MNTAPLADKIRPRNLKEFIGQEHLTSQGKPVFQMIKHGQMFSLILWGPPGSGKTTLAKILADSMRLDFFYLSAVSAGKNDLKKIMERIRQGESKRGSIVFLDEIHRFNKAQQDYLLPFVEDGTINLIGATTENPSFEVIGPLLSRTRVFTLKELDGKQIEQVIQRALKALDKELTIDQEAKDWLTNLSAGDARQVINLLENSFNLFKSKIKKEKKLTKQILETTLQSPYLRYDKAGEEHYNIISAFIKSMRASNVDAALYYLARMIAAGEDPLFIARRMVIFASEDIGMALPTALVVANEVFRACDTIGYPECAINLAHATVYLASAPKDRSSYNGLRAAQKDVEAYGNLPIPMNLRNAPTKLMEKEGYGKGYEMYPDKDKSLLPDRLKAKKYYIPKEGRNG